MAEIELVRRYPDSRPEDITDAYMRGAEVGLSLARGTCQMEFLEAAQFSDEDMRHYFEVGVYRCSECGTETYGRWTDGEELERPDFCPACGRKVVS